MRKSNTSPFRGAAMTCAFAALMVPFAASADPAPHGGVGVRLGTGGIGVDYSYGLNRYVDLRAGYSFGSYSRTQEEDDIDYDAELKINAFVAMVDIKPFAGGFRITTGLYSSSPELELNASGLDDYEVGDKEYRGNLKIDGGLDLGSAAPYLGIGWGGTTNTTGFGVSFDMGVMFTSSPDVALDASGRACDATANPACDPAGAEGFEVDGADPRAQQFQADLNQEVTNLEDDAKDFKLWPVIGLGLHYRF